MQWDRIEAEWSRMACRASGTGSLPAEGEAVRTVDAPTDAGPADAPTDQVTSSAVEMPDRILA